MDTKYQGLLDRITCQLATMLDTEARQPPHCRDYREVADLAAHAAKLASAMRGLNAIADMAETALNGGVPLNPPKEVTVIRKPRRVSRPITVAYPPVPVKPTDEEGWS
jgi:hypothetical protein